MTVASTSAATPAGTTAVSPANPKGAMGKNEFLKLLVAQLKHQDPLAPSDGSQMAAQLAQFSSLEQLQNINGTLSTQSSAQASVMAAMQASAAMNTLGKTIVAVGDQFNAPQGTDPRSLTVSVVVGSLGGTGTLQIMDAAGTVIGTRDLGNVKGGAQEFSLGSAAANLPSGDYRYAITVKDPAGNAVDVSTFMSIRVDSVRSTAGGMVLTGGGISIPFGQVTEVRT
jgi:flagellar basal-body rod modification protein FlgD